MKKNERVVVIGGSSGMGFEIAKMALAKGAEVVIAGRSIQRLEAACVALGENGVEIAVVDIGQQSEVAALFKLVGQLDHLVVTAADLSYGPVTELKESDLMRAVRSKLLGPLFAAQESASRIRPGGSITFTSGIAARRPMRGGAAAAAINSGLEGLARSLAIELAPLRVNVVSPGWTDTPIWDGMTGMTEDRKHEVHSSMAARLPSGRIGRVEDIAEAVFFLMKNGFVTGTVLDVDGGHRLV
ncbi:3-oxoacyl-[acyl-carrier-protein] reductase FabG [mine drainage metagenome]|uniref:3-oxoacyl-[acyl-carrier-protein] reductase FabG n=1 Tax=mine drainage metagenome TaxID=410659 RepID=A0A1J5T0P1_9ZZZZ